MAEPNVTVNQQTTNVIVTTEQQTPQVVNGQVVVTDTSKPANISITTLGENNTNNTQQLNITNNSDVRLVNVVNSSPNQAVDTQNIVVSRGSDVSVISADKGGPPGPPPEVLPHESDPYKLYVGGVEFSLPPGPTGPQGDIGPVGPIGPTGDLNAILFGTGTLPLLTYNDSTDILKIVGSGSTSVYYDDTNKKITISSLGTLYNPGSGLSLSGTTFHNTGVLYFNNRTGAVSLLSADVTGALGYTPLPTGNYSVVGHTHTSSNITDFNSSVSGLLPVKNITGSGVVNVTSVSGIYNVSVTGVQPSGNYAISGHTHTSSNITDFNSSVSGLISGIYQPLLINPIVGTGDTGYLTKWSNSGEINNSLIYDNGNYIGIGTNTPNANLTIAANGAGGTISGTSQSQSFQVNDGGSGPYINLAHFNITDGGARGSFLLSNNSSNAWENNLLQFFVHGASYPYGYYGNNSSDAGCAMIVTQGSEITKLQIGNYNSAPIEFFTNNTFRMIIDTAGNVGVGINPPAYKLDVDGGGNFNSLYVTGVPVSVSGHTHSSSDITNFNSSVSGLLPVKNVLGSGYASVNSISGIYTVSVTGLQPSGNYANAVHTHAISDVTGLQTSLDGKAALSHTHTVSQITDFNSGVSGLLPVKNIVGSGYASVSSVSGAYTVSVTGLQPSGNYSVVGHTHTASNITDFSSAVSGLLPSVTGSGFAISSLSNNVYTITVTGLQPSGNYSTVGHTHVTSDITNFASGVSGLVSGIYAPLNNPSLTGIPTAPTATSGTNNNQIATTQFVRTEVSNLVSSAPSTLDTLNELASALGNDPNFATTITNNLASKASISGVTFTGSVIIPSGTGNFNTLTVNNTGVSLNGHTHTTLQITNFNSGVSGLLPSVTGSGYVVSNFNNNIYTFNVTGLQPSGNYQIAFNNAVSGVGTSGYLTKWISNTAISSGLIYDNGTNIGIGITTPTGQLHVIGTGIFSNRIAIGTSGTASTEALIVGGNTAIGYPNENIDRTLTIHSSNASNKAMVLKNTNGSSYISYAVGNQNLYIGDASSRWLNVEYHAYGGGFHKFFGTNVTSPDMFINTSNGYVGIGSGLTASAQLHVSGSGIITDGLFLNDQTASTLTSFDTNKRLVSLSTALYPSLTEIAYIKGVTSSIQTQINNKQPSGNYAASSHTHTSSNITDFNSSVSGLVSGIYQSLLINPVTGVGTSGYLSKWTGSNSVSSGIIFDNGTNVGINTVNPSGKFHIESSVANNSYILLSSPSNVTRTHIGVGNSDSVPFLASTNNIQLASGNNGWGFFDRGTDGFLNIQRKSGSTSWSSVMTMNRSNGNVGIGTGVQATTPPEKLTVDGNIRVSDTTATQGNVVQFLRGGGGQYDYSIGKYGSIALAISLANDASSQRALQVGHHNGAIFNPKFHVNGYTGAVGINTTTPSGYLDVAGDIYVRGTGNNLGTIYFKSQVAGDNTLYAGATNGGDLVLNGGGASLQLSSQGGYANLFALSTQLHIGHGYDAGNAFQTIRFVPAAKEMMRMTTSGTLGIGLPTSSSSYAGNSVQLFNQQPHANTRVHIAGSGSDSGSAALIVTNSSISPLLYVRNDGSVGIGTTTPSTLLEISKDGGGVDLSFVRIANTNATGGTSLNISRTGPQRAAQVIYQSGTTNQFYQGILRDGGSTTNGWSVSAGADLNVTAPAIHVTSGNYVGIGTKSPQVLLHVNGQAYLQSLNLTGETADRILATDTNKNVVGLNTSTYPTLTELSYVKDATSSIQTQLNTKAPLSSPTFTGTPAAPTAPSGTNTTQIATTAFVRTEISSLVDAAPGTLDTLNELAAALGDDPNFATTVASGIATKIAGTGTINYVPKFTASQTLQNSLIFDNGTNVGVGLSSPNTKLHIEKPLAVLNPTNLVNHSAVGLSVTIPDVALDTGSGIAIAIGMNDRGRSYIGSIWDSSNKDQPDLAFYTTWGTNGVGERLRIKADGKVGIGTSSPSSQLHVVGSALFASGLNISNQTASTIASFDANKNIVSLSTGTYPSLIELSYVKDVTSSIQTQINSKQNTLINPVTGTGTNGKLSKWSSTSTLTDSILSESSTVINIAGSLNGQSDDTYLSFDANARRIGMTKKNGFTGKFTYGSGSSFAIAQSNSGTIEATNTFTDRLVIDTIGNVGIGLTNPAEKLDVSGNIKVAGANTSLTIAQDDATTMRMRSAGNLIVAAGSAANVRFLISTTEHARLSDQGRFGIGLAAPSGKLGVAGGVTVGTNYNVTPPTNGMIVEGNVGIGIGNPVEKLEIDGSLKFFNCATRILRADNNSLKFAATSSAMGHYGIYIDNTATSGGRNFRLASWADGTTGKFIIRDDTSGADRLAIDANGYVGIGMNNPSDRIHVSGAQTTIRLNNSLSYDTQLRLTDTASDWSVGINQGNTLGSGVFGIRSLTAGASRLVINTSGNVGIGTDAPAEKLHVVGNISAGTISNTKGNFIAYGSAGQPNLLFEGFGSDGTARISTNSGSNRQLKIENDGASTTLGVYIEGDVGIGTTTPTYKLQVNGSFAASTKSFRIDHPSKKDHSLEYGSLESPYHGVRLTGRGTVIKGVGVVSLPDYLKDLIHDDDTLNVQITNIKHGKTIYLEEIDLKNDRFIVKVDRAKSLGELQFCWTLTGVRKDVDHLVVEKRN